MNLEHLIIELYLRIDRAYRAVVGVKPLRTRGFEPAFHDVEALTVEVFGELQGHHDTKALWRYARNHWRAWFPCLPPYKDFSERCANLRWVKEKILRHLWPPGDAVVVDGLPLPLCHVVRAHRCRRLRDVAAFGYCAAKDEHYWGVKGYPVMRLDGRICAFWTQPANADERSILDNFIGFFRGWVLGDKGFQSQPRADELALHGVSLVVPTRKNMKRTMTEAFEKLFKDTRRGIETALSRLVEGFAIVRSKARSPLSYFANIFRKLLAYNFTLDLNLSP